AGVLPREHLRATVLPVDVEELDHGARGRAGLRDRDVVLCVSGSSGPVDGDALAGGVRALTRGDTGARNREGRSRQDRVRVVEMRANFVLARLQAVEHLRAVDLPVEVRPVDVARRRGRPLWNDPDPVL